MRRCHGKKSETRGPLILIAMKRTFLFLLTAVMLGFGLQSCEKEDNNGNDTTSVQWVDLGLPSGLLWADRNVGAASPEDYGNYYAWGETVPKEVYDWTSYAYGNYFGWTTYGYGYFNALTKYCTDPEFGLNGFTDNLTTLEASDDAATVNIGGKARTPTKDEWQELMDNTTSTWTTRNGVNGRLLTASNGKSLFLPAAGERNGSSLEYAGEWGVYLSSTLNAGGPDGMWDFYFYSDDQYWILSHRSFGLSVRAVRAK